MTDRIQKMLDEYKQESKHFQICTEKVRIVVDAFKRYEAWPIIIKRAKAAAEFLDQRTIFIGEDELLVGHVACKPHGTEFRPASAGWDEEDLAKVLADNGCVMSDEDRNAMKELNEYFAPGKMRDTFERQTYYYDDEFLFPWRQRGVVNPAWKDKFTGQGNAALGYGWTLNDFNSLYMPDYEMQLYSGFQAYIDKAKKMRAELRIENRDDMDKADLLDATIIEFEAAIRICRRYADLAEKMSKECKDPKRAAELAQIAETCRQVPAGPARTFREGMQAMAFYWCFFASPVVGLGRFDVYMRPLYEADIKAGRITREEARELIDNYRLLVADTYFLKGNAEQRSKWAGLARWNNMILGGIDRDGNDVTNDLSYLVIESAKEMHIPHPTITIRVNGKNPKEFMRAAVDCVRTGLGYPAFISEQEYMDYMIRFAHIDPVEAREFAINGCIDIALPGRSRNGGVNMFITPTILELAMHNGFSPWTKYQLVPPCGKFEDFKTWDEFYAAYLKVADRLIDGLVQTNNIRMLVEQELYPDAMIDGFYRNSLEIGKSCYRRVMPYETHCAFNTVGMVDSINSLAALKKLVFDDKVVSAADMLKALDNNWEGFEELRKKCLAVPKYGNDEEYVDAIGEQLWKDLREIAERYRSVFGTPVMTSAISITAHAPGGKNTMATPDGRFCGDTLSDGSVSPARGTEKNGPLGVLKSAMRMSKGWSVNLHNMKLLPSTLKTDEDMDKLGNLISTYLTNGGKHIQFNVVDTETLEKARKDPEEYRDLIVRVAGYSTYFTILTPAVQQEVIERTAHENF